VTSMPTCYFGGQLAAAGLVCSLFRWKQKPKTKKDLFSHPTQFHV